MGPKKRSKLSPKPSPFGAARACALAIALTSGLATSLIAFVTRPAYALPATPKAMGIAEKEAKRISIRLKPISEEIWKEVAAQKFTEVYEVAKGDTLSGISQILFGDLKYWPKIWALNNAAITNPHWIKPGMKLAFHSGGLGDLPQMSLETKTDAATGPIMNDGTTMNEDQIVTSALAAGRSVEWHNLPRQPWERVSMVMPKGVDSSGFINNPMDRKRRELFFEPESLIATSKLEVAGEIVGARSEGKFVAAADTVFLSPAADGSLQVGDTYTVLDKPEVVKSRKTDRSGKSRLILGEVKIIGVRDGLFIGNVEKSRNVIPRGAEVVTRVQPIPKMTPIPGPLPVEGVLMVDRRISTFMNAQFKQVFIDRGSNDGVQPGMVFRVYQYYDPSTQKKITESDFIIDADVQVLMVSEEISLVEIISSKSAISENSVAVLLTDVSDLIHDRKHGMKDLSGYKSTDELDELDKLDKLDEGGLGKKEAEELKQLEKWTEEGDQASPTPPPATDGSTPPADTGTPGEDEEVSESNSEPAPESPPADEAAPSTELESDGTSDSAPETAPDTTTDDLEDPPAPDAASDRSNEESGNDGASEDMPDFEDEPPAPPPSGA